MILHLNLFCTERKILFRTLKKGAPEFFFFLFAAFLFICPLSIFLSPPAGAEPLKAGIQFDSDLAPLKSGLREGERMNLGATETKKEITEWRRIPDWFAGTWHKERSKRFVNGRPIYYQTRADLITGYQKDAKGRIWQPVFVSVGQVETDDYIEYQMPQRKTVYAIENGKYTSFSLSTRLRVDKDSGQIISSFQQEDLSVSKPDGDGLVKAVVECRVFNQDGKVQLEDTIEVLEERTEEFNPIDEFNGVNYRQSFFDFLEASGHPELIPAERPKSILTESQERILSDEAKANRMAGHK